ncbi:MAG: DUF3857 domain-containing protein [Phaeodactylibacter sp.]|nr:DUF3857 domain-containing protein [Phaeodactylibacter sp.]MCB9302034.1 DUF3857 domain-containing protein [Lewinellaceae bacterium]HQU57758.1 DUF3857 domain-containing protein [Saprospiraceae bacterium]
MKLSPLSMAGALMALLFLLFSSDAQAQKEPIKWGKVPAEELKMATYEADTSAAALVLADYGNIYFDLGDGKLKYVLEHHRRIKILKRSGFDYGDVSIGYYEDGEKITGFKAHTITPNGETFDLDKSDIFEEKVSDDWARMKFTFPRLEEGAVLEYQYNLTSEYYFSLREWYFQREIPTLYSELRLKIPEWYDYIFLNQGRNYDVSETDQRTESIRVPNVVQSDAFGNQQRGIDLVQARVNAYRFAMKDVPAMKEESYVTTMDDYLARLRFQLRSVQYPGSGYNPVLSDWPTVAKELMEHEHFGQQFTKSRFQRAVMEELEPVLAGAATKAEKAKLAYAHLAKIMEWDEDYSFLAGEDVDDCLKRRKGSSGELNLLLLAALTALDVECYPLLVSTRGHGKMLELYPILNQFNHVAVIADIDGQAQLFDLGSHARPAGIPRTSSLNGMGWIVNPANPQWIELTPPMSKSARMFKIAIDGQGAVHSEVQEKHEGYYAVSYRQQILDDKECAFVREDWQKHFPDTEVQSLSFKGATDLSEPVSLSFQADVPAGAQVVGDFIYFNPILMPDFEENPFKLQTRDYPVDINYPFDLNNIFFVDIPEGYAVEEVPESVKITLPNEGGKFEYLISEMGPDKLRVICRLTLRQLHFEPADYPTIKNFFDILLEKQNEQIVFKKQI